MTAPDAPRSPRRKFSGTIYFSFEQTEAAMRAQWINGWLDAGDPVLGLIDPDDPASYVPLDEALEPGIGKILCRLADGRMRHIYGYQHEPAAPAPTAKEDKADGA
jgi:hypothetical protein